MALEVPPASSPAVHNVMIANTSKDTKPELRVRRIRVPRLQMEDRRRGWEVRLSPRYHISRQEDSHIRPRASGTDVRHVT